MLRGFKFAHNGILILLSVRDAPPIEKNVLDAHITVSADNVTLSVIPIFNLLPLSNKAPLIKSL